MKIHAKIAKAIADCNCEKNYKPTRLYLGKSQMDELMAWAIEYQYINNADLRTGAHRPEVQGLPVYEVNAEDHCVAA